MKLSPDDHKRRDLGLLPRHAMPKNWRVPCKPLLALIAFIIGFGLFILFDFATS